MLYTNTDIKSFAKKYGISLKPVKCLGCKKDRKWTKVFYHKNNRGIETDVCDCGQPECWRYIKIDDDLNNKVKELFNLIES